MHHHSNTLLNLAHQYHLEGLSWHSLQALNDGEIDYSIAKAQQFLKFQQRINRELLRHKVITDNSYTRWFEQGEQNSSQLKAFIIQFSVFSNQFMVAQLNKMIHADTLEGMRASKEILANELGVNFSAVHSDQNSNNVISKTESTEGSVEGSTFHFAAGHFEWLYSIAKQLGLHFKEIGQPRHGTKSTLFFCDELIRLYGGDNYLISQAASYSVENWAAAGFWKQLIQGLKRFNHGQEANIPLGFFVWHDQIEAQHATHTQEELEQLYFTQQLNEDDFIRYGNEMLDAVAVFWDGLYDQKGKLETIH